MRDKNHMAEEILSKFSDHLFWDVDRNTVDMERNASFMVQRVLEYGLLSDWIQLRSYYGIDRIAKEAMTLRSLEPRALSFIANLSKTKKEDYRCYILRQSNQQPWNY